MNRRPKTLSTLIAVVALSAPLGATGMVLQATAQAATQTTVALPKNDGLKLPLADVAHPWIAAHRGQWRNAPENSIPAILGAARDGAQVIEIDIQRTADGHLVLMHDATVNRTTNGTGRVSELTLAQIKQLRLREGMGNGPAPLTNQTVPTFGEVLKAVRGHNVLLNLDKGWDYREQLYTELKAAGMVPYALFKGAPNAAEATDFMTRHPDAQYMHIINDGQVADFEQFTTVMPDAIEIAFNTLDDVQASPAYVAKVGAATDVWMNAMWNSVGGGLTDEASIRDPHLGWAKMVGMGADVIQTDNVKMMNAWRAGRDVTRVGMKNGSIRVQAEDFIDDPAFYKDFNPRNECSKPIRNPNSPVDACDLDGAHIVQYIRDGEFFTLEVDVPQPGNWSLSLRNSADTEPGGTVTVSVDGDQTRTVKLPNTTHNRSFTVTDLGKFKFSKGTQRIKLSFTHPDYASVDWLQLDRGARPDRELMDYSQNAR